MKSRIQTQILSTLILSILTISSIRAQLFEIPLDEKIEQSVLIVEGEVVESQSYFGRVGEIYTAHRVAIDQTLKGHNLSEDYVTVLTKGGQVEGVTETWTHQLTLNVGENGIFFLKPTDYPAIEDANFPSPSYDVYSSLQGFLKYGWSNGRRIAVEPFHTYSNIGLVKDKIQGKHVESFEPNGSEGDEEDCIVYSFEPGVSSNPYKIAIDIKVRLLSGSKKLYKSLVAIEYDTTFWGANVVANGVITVVDGSISSSTAYDLSSSDYAPNILEVAVEQTGNLSGLFTLTTTKSHLATVLIPIASLPGLPNFEFKYELMEQENEYYNTSTQRGEPFPCIKVEEDIFAVDPDITDFSPKVVAAGVRDFSLNAAPIPGKITIYGSGFGVLGVDFDTTDLGNDYRVEFKHANVGPTGNWVSPGVRNDYVFWTDDSIQVYVPSIGEFEDDNTIAQDNFCGTGFIRVVAGKGFLGIPRTDESDTVLTVRYSVRNGATSDIMKPPLQSIRGKIMGYFDGGVPFYYNPNFPNAARHDVEWAMSEWRCKVGINLNIQEQANIPAAALPFACEITWGSLPAGASTSTGAYVAFSTGFTPCFSTNDSSAIHSRHDFNTLSVNSALSWHLGPDSVALSFNQHDLRSALLHEVGHCGHIQHSLNDEELMFFSPEQNSKYFRVITPDACLAGEHMVAFSSSNQPTLNCDGSPDMVPVGPGDCQLVFTNSTRDISELVGVKIYPSPTSNEFTIDFDNPLVNSVKVRVLNSTGQQIYISEMPKHSKTKKIDVSHIRPDVYYLLIEVTGNQIFTTKIIKI